MRGHGHGQNDKKFSSGNPNSRSREKCSIAQIAIVKLAGMTNGSLMNGSLLFIHCLQFFLSNYIISLSCPLLSLFLLASMLTLFHLARNVFSVWVVDSNYNLFMIIVLSFHHHHHHHHRCEINYKCNFTVLSCIDAIARDSFTLGSTVTVAVVVVCCWFICISNWMWNFKLLYNWMLHCTLHGTALLCWF